MEPMIMIVVIIAAMRIFGSVPVFHGVYIDIPLLDSMRYVTFTIKDIRLGALYGNYVILIGSGKKKDGLRV